MKQTYDNYVVLAYNDGSTDNTQSEILKHQGMFRKYYFQNAKSNMGAAYRRCQLISLLEYEPEDVIILLGMDDELLPNALERIKQEYDAGKWMTYGNWINQNGVGLPADFDLDFPQEIHDNRDYRKVLYRSTSPNTFKRKLFNKIPIEDFKIGEEWINTTTESELMFSCLEMCGQKRIGVIKDKIYMYNQGIPNSAQRRLGQAYKNQIYNIVINRPKKPLYENC